MKKGLVIMSVITVFIFSLGLVAWVYAADKPPDTVKIDNDKSLFKDGKRTKPPVEFSHLKHVKQDKIACTQCHHVYEGRISAKKATGEKDVKNTWKEGDKVHKCSECHKAVQEGVKLTLQIAYHKNCQDCHKKLKAEGKKTGPILCAQCHVPEKK